MFPRQLLDSGVHLWLEYDMNARLQGRTALVTGATGGIGAAIAIALAAEGAYVLVSGRNAERGEKIVATITADGGRATFIAADLASGATAIGELAQRAMSAAGEAGGQLDILVNNAAMLIVPSATGAVTEELIDEALSTNIKAAFLLTGALAPPMAARGHGAVINIGSINGLLGMAGSALYSTTKAAIHSLTKSWAAEFGPAGVRVNTVAPGPTLTEKVTAMQDRLAPMIETMPSRRASEPFEVAAAVVFLASNDASNIHGATLSIDGGRAAV
jgi:NAD(P)-dependent dehydrogenase (short-subunit alcohol dehydrogenase family)